MINPKFMRWMMFGFLVFVIALFLTACSKNDGYMSLTEANTRTQELIKAAWLNQPRTDIKEGYSQIMENPPGIRTLCGYYTANGSRKYFAVNVDTNLTPYCLDQPQHMQMFCDKGAVLAWTK